MKKLIFFHKKCATAKTRSMVGIGPVAILAVLVAVSFGSAQAAGIEQQSKIHSGSDSNSGILLAANDAHAADAAKKDAKKASAASAPAKAAEKPHGIAGWLLDYLAKNPFA